MKTCFTALELFMTSYLIVPCSLCSFKWKYHHVHASLELLNSVSEPHLSLWGGFSATLCSNLWHWNLPVAPRGHREWRDLPAGRNLGVQNVGLLTNLEAFANINCYHFPEILDVIFNSGFPLPLPHPHPHLHPILVLLFLFPFPPSFSFSCFFSSPLPLPFRLPRAIPSLLGAQPPQFRVCLQVFNYSRKRCCPHSYR